MEKKNSDWKFRLMTVLEVKEWSEIVIGDVQNQERSVLN